jgi:hypothetical protein
MLTPQPTTGPHLALDPAAFLPCFNTRACPVRHRLAGCPLLEIPALLRLAQRLPARHVRINSGNAPVDATPAQIPGAARSALESFERIAECETRIMLKGIEHDAEYGALLRACLAEIEALGSPVTRAVVAREGYVFLSSPGMTTPYHMDPEINFLLQVRGRKTFFVLPEPDRSVLSEEDIERFYAGEHESLPFKPEAAGRAAVFAMAPGDGVHIPVNHPHWVQTSDEVTISFALTLQTAATRRRGAVYAVNHRLRRAGLTPTPFGRSPLRDALKYRGYRLWNALSPLFRRRRAPDPAHTPAHPPR